MRARRQVLLFVASIAAASQGCGDEDAATASGDATTASSGGQGGEGVQGGAGGAGGFNPGTGGGAACDPGDPASCAAGTFCDDYDNQCDPRPSAASCIEAALACEGRGPVCACDGAVYPTDCDAYGAGVDLAASGCAAPPDTFFCEAFLCASSDACMHAVGLTSHHECVPPPGGCGPTPDCSCFGSFGCSCAEDAEGHIILTCSVD